VTTRYPLAADLGLLGCESCGLVLSAPSAAGPPLRCVRCGFTLHRHKPHSVQRTAAFLVTAAVLYVPANVLPVMSTNSVLGRRRPHLAGGILELWTSGSWNWR